MAVQDIPRRLLSMLPFIGGSGEPDRSTPPSRAPAAAAETDEGFDDPEEVEEEDEAGDELEDDEPEEPDELEDDEPEEPEDDEPEEPDEEPEAEAAEDTEDEESAAEDAAATTVDISDTTAPSIGPNTVIEKRPPEERLAGNEQSDTDAMGQDKRRQVIGGTYSASFGKQLIRWALVIAVIAAAGFGAKLLVDDLDKAPAQAAERAPWSDNEQPPAPLE